jgi:hypothetical protein
MREDAVAACKVLSRQSGTRNPYLAQAVRRRLTHLWSASPQSNGARLQRRRPRAYSKRAVRSAFSQSDSATACTDSALVALQLHPAALHSENATIVAGIPSSYGILPKHSVLLR